MSSTIFGYAFKPCHSLSYQFIFLGTYDCTYDVPTLNDIDKDFFTRRNSSIEQQSLISNIILQSLK